MLPSTSFCRALPRAKPHGVVTGLPLPHGLVRGVQSCKAGKTGIRPMTRMVFMQGSSQEGGSTGDGQKNTLSSLDSMLGVKEKQEGKGLADWWRTPPRQDAAPRRTAWSEGRSGRFILNEDFLVSDNKAGLPTEMGNKVEVPRVMPFLSYVLLMLQVIVFGTYTNIASMQGPEAAEEFLGGLANVHQQVAVGEIYRLGSSLLISPSVAALAVTAWGLVLLAPELEAVMGYATFLSIYILSGLTGTVVQHALTGEVASSAGISLSASCGAMASVLGVSGALMVHRMRNKGMEDMTGPAGPASSSSGEASKSKDLQLALHTSIVWIGSSLLLLQPIDEGYIWMQMPALIAAGTVGVLLGSGQCPIYQVTQEVVIPDGSMIVPEKLEEVVVVVDVRSRLQRKATVVAVSLGLLGLAASCIHG